MTRDLDMLKVDVDVIEMVIGSRGARGPSGAQTEDSADRHVDPDSEQDPG